MSLLTLSLLLGAAGVGFTHTVLGPDHYLPFIMLGRARRWSDRKTLLVTLACGGGHVLSSVVLGLIGIAMGLAIGQVKALESGRGSLAAWGLVAFGLAYAAWGIRKGIRRARGLEAHSHGHHVHVHSHGRTQHVHVEASSTPFWTLFIIFILGPCEPLIPFFMLPAADGDWLLAVAMAAVFALITVTTMVAMVALGLAGLKPRLFAPLARWDHALAGGIIAATGMGVLVLGL